MQQGALLFINVPERFTNLCRSCSLSFWSFSQMHEILPYSPTCVAHLPLGSFFQKAVGGFSAAPVDGLEAPPLAWPLIRCLMHIEALSIVPTADHPDVQTLYIE